MDKQFVDKIIPSIKPKQKEVSDETVKEFSIKKLISTFHILDSEIAEREEQQLSVLERLEEYYGTVQCPLCFEFLEKEKTTETEQGFICKDCIKI